MAHDDQTLLAGDRSTAIGPSLGTRFADRYDIVQELGEGGMGIVYRAHDTTLDEVVALKVLKLTGKSDVSRFLREVRLARRVTHHNVVRTHDIGEHGGLHYLTMEFVPGRSLAERLAEHAPLPLEEVISIGRDVACGLAAAHASRVIHRDLKPANVLLGDKGRVVLTDFGIARNVDLDPATGEVGQLVGTPAYLAPEQIMGAPGDARSDIFALGVMLYELATGRMPWSGNTPLATAMQRLETPAADPRDFVQMPDSLADFLVGCLEREPTARVESAEAALSQLQILCHTPSPRVGPSAPTPRRLYAPLISAVRTLAVVPFHYQGPPEHDYLGDAVAQELIDTLSRTRDIRVLGLGASRRLGALADPADFHRELGADVLVTGEVTVDGETLHMASRVLDTKDGLQRWTERSSGRFGGAFDLQQALGRRVAEALRIQIDASAHQENAPSRAVEAYLKGRSALRTDLMSGAPRAIELLQRCVDLAPDFRPGLAAHAMASVHAWWSVNPSELATMKDVVQKSVERARSRAPDLAETQLACAMFATQIGDFRSAAQSYVSALEVAPTLVEGHLRLGVLQREAGRYEEGVRRLELALELDPRLHLAHLELARGLTLRGDRDRARHHEAELVRALGHRDIPLLLMLARHALYREDQSTFRELLKKLDGLPVQAARAFGRLFAAADDMQAAELEEHLDLAMSTFPQIADNLRFSSLIKQLCAEVLAATRRDRQAVDMIVDAANEALIDIEWMEHCPLLDPFRSDLRFIDAQTRVRRRAEAIWI